MFLMGIKNTLSSGEAYYTHVNSNGYQESSRHERGTQAGRDTKYTSRSGYGSARRITLPHKVQTVSTSMITFIHFLQQPGDVEIVLA